MWCEWKEWRNEWRIMATCSGIFYELSLFLARVREQGWATFMIHAWLDIFASSCFALKVQLVTKAGKSFDHKRKHPESNSKSSFHDWIIYELFFLCSLLLPLRWCMHISKEKDEFKNFMVKALWYDKIGSDRRIFNSIFVYDILQVLMGGDEKIL